MQATRATRGGVRLFDRPADATTDPSHEAAFSALYRAHGARVYAFLRYRVGDAAVAEDLAAEVFARAWAKRDTWRSPESAAAWLFATARNLAADRHRRREPLPLAAIPPARHPSAPTPEEGVLLDERLDRLTQALATLSDREREVIGLRFVAELRHREIARVIGTSEGNVAKIVHRALAKLRERLAAEETRDV